MGVGTDHGTSAFAVATLRDWWEPVGRDRYPGADRLLICADGDTVYQRQNDCTPNCAEGSVWNFDYVYGRDAGVFYMNRASEP